MSERGFAIARLAHIGRAAAPDASERMVPDRKPEVSCGTPALNTYDVNDAAADERLDRLAPEDRAVVARRVFQLRLHGASFRLIALLLDVTPAAAKELYLERLEAQIAQHLEPFLGVLRTAG